MASLIPIKYEPHDTKHESILFSRTLDSRPLLSPQGFPFEDNRGMCTTQQNEIKGISF